MVATRRTLNTRAPSPRPARGISGGSVSVSVAGTGLIDGDYGDITVSGTGTAMAIDAGAVTNAKLRNSSATSVIGRSAGSAGAPADIAAAADGDVLRRAAGILGWGAIPQASVTSLVADLATLTAGLAGTVPSSRLVSTTAPLAGGGDLSADRTLSVNANGITDAFLRQGAATSIIGRSAGTVGDVADIAATADGDVLRRAAGTLGWGSIPQASVTSLVADLAAKAPTSRLIDTIGALTGGGDLSADRTLSIVPNGITDNMLRQSGANAVIGRSAGSAGNVADIQATADGDVLRRAAGALGFGAIPQASVTNLTTDLAAKALAARLISTSGALSGGGDLSADRTLIVANNGITDALLRTSAALSVIGRSANSVGNVADIAAAADGDVLRRSGTTLGFGAVAQASITNLVTDLAAKLPGLVGSGGSVTTSSTTGASSGFAPTLAVGTYLIIGYGTHTTAVNTTALRLVGVASGGLVLSHGSLMLEVMTAVNTMHPSFTTTLIGTATAGANGVTTSSPILCMGMAIVTTGGTLTINVASEVAGSNVTLERSAWAAIKVA